MSIGAQCNTFTGLYNLSEEGFTVEDETASKIADAVQAELSGNYGYNLWGPDELLELCQKMNFPIKQIR